MREEHRKSVHTEPRSQRRGGECKALFESQHTCSLLASTPTECSFHLLNDGSYEVSSVLHPPPNLEKKP